MHTHLHTRNTLIKRAKSQQDDAAWRELVDLYKPYIYVVIRSMEVPADDADDLLQQTLIAIWKSLPDYQYNPEQAKFRTWLNKVTRNQVLSHFRKKQSHKHKLEKFVDQGHAQTDDSEQSDIHEAMFSKEWELFLSNAAMRNIEQYFSANALAAFKLFLEGKDSTQISQELEVNRDSVYKYISRIKAKLTEEIAHLKHDLDI